MNIIKLNKSLITLAWLLLIIFFTNQLPGFTQNSTTNDFQNLNNILRKNKIYTQDNTPINIGSTMYNMETSFNAFPNNSTIDITLRDIDLPSALRIIAKEGHKNIVIDKSVKGTISAELKHVSLNEAMQTILTIEELEARVNDNTIYIASRSAMSLKGLNRKYIKAFKLNNANVVDVAQLIEASIFNKGYKVDETKSTNTATTSPINQNRNQNTTNMQQNLLAQDSTTNQSSLVENKEIRAQIEKLTPGSGFNDASKLASEIKLQGITSTIDKVKVNNNDNGPIVIPDTRTNSLLIAGLPNDIALAAEAIQYLDQPLHQVSIQVSLIEVNKNNTDDLGLNVSGVAGKFGAGFNSSSDGKTNIIYNTIKSTSDNLSIELNALIQRNKAKLLANPNVLALDGSESLIKITDQVVSKMTVTSQSQTGSLMYDPTLSDVGIVLNILPKIGDDGYITMRLRPSITTALDKITIGTDGAFATPISTREVIMQDVRVKSGQTLAIAGLINDSEVEKMSKLPFVSDLPIFGKLFTDTTKTHSKTELVILITPTIMN